MSCPLQTVCFTRVAAVRSSTGGPAAAQRTALAQLVDALLGQDKYTGAEALILSGYKGLKSREATILHQGKRRLPEASERVAKLYQTWAKPEKAAEWREKI